MLADKAAYARDARVVLDLEQRAVGLVELCELRQALVGVLVHGAELVHVEGADLAAPPDALDALLGVDGAAWALNADGDAEDDRGDQQHRYRAQRERDVERPLHEAVAQPSFRRRRDGHGALGLRHQLGRQERHVGGGHRLGAVCGSRRRRAGSFDSLRSLGMTTRGVAPLRTAFPDPCARLYITALIIAGLVWGEEGGNLAGSQ